jgi:hypothetical protein
MIKRYRKRLAIVLLALLAVAISVAAQSTVGQVSIHRDVTYMQGSASAGATTTGNGQPLNVLGYGAAGFSVDGTSSGLQLITEATTDVTAQTGWKLVACTDQSTQQLTSTASTITANGMYSVLAPGAAWIRTRCAAIASGTVTSAGRAQFGYVTRYSGGGGGAGTVTSFSAGNLSPLFTSNVATPTSTPALTFTLSTQLANLVFAGPTGGSAAAPGFRLLVTADIPALAESAVTNLVNDLLAKAPLASPAFTGSPTAPTPATNDNSTLIATTAYVQAQGYLASVSFSQLTGSIAIGQIPNGIITNAKLQNSTISGVSLGGNLASSNLTDSANIALLNTANSFSNALNTFFAIKINGTAGAGYVEYAAQSSAPAAPSAGYRDYADSLGRRSWIRASDGFTRTWDATLTANRIYTLFDASDTLVGLAVTQVLSNKTYDTASNTFKIAGTTITAISGNTATLASVTGALTNTHLAVWDASGNLKDGGAVPAGGVTSVTANDSSLTISPTTGAVLAALNVGNANTWTGIQTLGAGLLKATSPWITTQINDANGNAILSFSPMASAVNNLQISNTISSNSPVISAVGTGTNLSITLTPKGTGSVIFPAGAKATPGIKFPSQVDGFYERAGGAIDFVANNNDMGEFNNSLGLLLTTNSPVVGWTGSATTGSGNRTGISEAAAKVVAFGNGGSSDTTGWYVFNGTSRVTGDLTNATASMSNITGISSTLIAGRKYVGRLTVKCTNSTAAEGIQFDFNGGTATMTSFYAAGGVLASGGTDTVGTNISTSLSGPISFSVLTGETVLIIEISMVVNAAGTFIPRFAENTSATGTATVRLGTFQWLQDTP